MVLKAVRTIVMALCLTAPVVTSSVGAATPNALAILTKALGDGSREANVTLSGTLTASGSTLSLNGGFAARVNGGTTTVSGIGTEDEVQPIGENYCFVKASSIAVLHSELEVKKPTAAEVGVWYEVPSSDPRYVSIASPGGAQSIAQVFSFSSIGWKRSAVYEGTLVLHGVRVIELTGASNLFASGSGFVEMTMDVTDTSKPLPFAISGPPGTDGLLYFSKWDATSVAIPTARAKLPS